jgi:hypothetical protein
MAARKGKPYAVTLAPFIGVTEVKIVRTADGAVIHHAWHTGGTDRALRIANAILDQETGVDTSAADAHKPVSLVKPAPKVDLRKPVSLRKSRLDFTRQLVTRLHP